MTAIKSFFDGMLVKLNSNLTEKIDVIDDNLVKLGDREDLRLEKVEDMNDQVTSIKTMLENITQRLDNMQAQ